MVRILPSTCHVPDTGSVRKFGGHDPVRHRSVVAENQVLVAGLLEPDRGFAPMPDQPGGIRFVGPGRTGRTEHQADKQENRQKRSWIAKHEVALPPLHTGAFSEIVMALGHTSGKWRQETP